MQRDPIVIIGGFGSDWRDYQELARLLAGIAERRVFITHVTRATWVLGGFSDYKLLVDCAHQAVLHALRITGASKVVLVGHSAGGVIGRGYLADKAIRPHHTPHHGHARVSRLIMLGSPLRGGPISNQPGMRQAAWLDETYPGAYWPGVQYLSVRGRLIQGRLGGGSPREILAFRNYEFLGAAGNAMGDGVVPESLAAVAGIPLMDIEGIGHSPLWGRWFGNDVAATRAWWQYFDVGDRVNEKVAYA